MIMETLQAALLACSAGGMQGMMQGMEIKACGECGRPLPNVPLLVALHEAMGVEPFTVSQLLVSTFSVGTYWPAVRERESPAKSVGRLLLATPGVQPAGHTREKAKKWRVDPAFLPPGVL